jgi:glycerol-3-phosphate acyltransferase PlsY
MVEKLLIFCLLAYFIGSIPFGIIVGRYIKGIDLQKEGSGNIGAANAFRVMGPVWGAIVLLGDFLKGVVSLMLAQHYFLVSVPPLFFILVGLFAILGHNYSIYLRFKGGKGVATTAGVFFFISWKAALTAFSFWAVIIFFTGFASLGSLAASLALPVCMLLFKEPFPYMIFAAAAFLLIVYTHRSNIVRLLTGREKKLQFKKTVKS